MHITLVVTLDAATAINVEINSALAMAEGKRIKAKNIKLKKIKKTIARTLFAVAGDLECFLRSTTRLNRLPFVHRAVSMSHLAFCHVC